jgi:hypothetical protein
MNERPLQCRDWEVRAILEGRKTQTRMAVKGRALSWLDPDMFTPAFVALPENGLCPHGIPGDRLWIRETFSVAPTPGCSIGEAIMGKKLTVTYRSGGERHVEGGSFTAPGMHVDFAAADYDQARYGVWRPSIVMPRWASRITLAITEVRLQRVQEISEKDAKAEGVEALTWSDGSQNGYKDYMWHVSSYESAKESFSSLWDSLNAERGFPWASNPWVWAVMFRRVEDNP